MGSEEAICVFLTSGQVYCYATVFIWVLFVCNRYDIFWWPIFCYLLSLRCKECALWSPICALPIADFSRPHPSSPSRKDLTLASSRGPWSPPTFARWGAKLIYTWGYCWAKLIYIWGGSLFSALSRWRSTTWSLSTLLLCWEKLVFENAEFFHHSLTKFKKVTYS